MAFHDIAARELHKIAEIRKAAAISTRLQLPSFTIILLLQLYYILAFLHIRSDENTGFVGRPFYFFLRATEKNANISGLCLDCVNSNISPAAL